MEGGTIGLAGPRRNRHSFSMITLPPATTRPDPAAFAHVRTWIFDLDNTLYPASCNLFTQVSQRMI